ncbi:glycosyltransferase family 1 protein [Pedobacter sp. SYP-B3415]|uniref:glycosyltransferase family 4 protein n=1 Tax=Pedobacter sp. SYP-B3415 TaxID=2496641 RepID=UPI00101D5F0C|nr:glycosyltransferase family 1 protein [Pedobacter sp. SYP-B3415]
MVKERIYINGRFLTRPITGVERTAYELIRALDQIIDKQQVPDSYEYVVIYSGEIVNPITLKHIKLLKKGVLKGNAWEQFELPVYTAGRLLVSLCTISTLFKRRQLLMVHDASFAANPQFFPKALRKWYNFAIPILGKKVCRLITVSQFSKAELCKYFGFKPYNIDIIYNSAEHILRFGRPGEAFKKRINSLKPYVLAVSSLSANKNFRGLSEAIKQVDFKNYRMLIAGGAMKTLQQTTLDPAVVQLGYVCDAELRYLYSQAALFVFPSFYEGFGIPPLEAMVSGCPVLASGTSSMPEVLGDACEFFDPDKTGTLALKLSALLNDGHRLEALKLKGQERASLYNWNTSAIKLYRLIEQYVS